jgi:hypothetical protein
VGEQLARAAETGDLDFISGEIRQRRARWDPEFTLQILGRSKPQHPAVKCDRRNFPLAPRRPAGELRKRRAGSSGSAAAIHNASSASAPFGWSRWRSGHTNFSVWWVRNWVRPSAMTPGAMRVMVNRASSLPFSVVTGRRMSTSGKTGKPAGIGEPAMLAPGVGTTEGGEM